MKFEIDIKEPSTIRGIVWIISGLLAAILILFGTKEKADAIMAIAAIVAGGFGVATKDGKSE